MTMVVDAEFEEIPVTEQELDLTADESLPWLESDEDDTAAGGIDSVQVITFISILILLAAAIVAAVWYFTRGPDAPDRVADGSTIEAPAGPIKERPEDPGGKEFDGTGNLAPGVGEGEVRDGQIGDGQTGDTSREAPQDAPRPSIDTQTTGTRPAGTNSSGNSASNQGGVAVQLAAYGNRARAEKGWRDLSRSSDALDGVRYRIVEANVDIGTVYRLQAMAPNRAEADALCDAIKADGLECAVKP